MTVNHVPCGASVVRVHLPRPNFSNMGECRNLAAEPVLETGALSGVKVQVLPPLPSLLE